MASSAPGSVFLAVVAALVAGCTVNPQPEPPLRPIDPHDVMEGEDAYGPDETLLILRDGSAPSDAIAWIFDLGRPDCPADAVEVDEDGGFEAVVCGDAMDLRRIQLVQNTVWTPPVDLVVGGRDALPGPEEMACATIEPGRHLLLEATPVGTPVEGVVTVSSVCADPITIDEVAFRTSTAALAAFGPPPMVLSGESAEIRVSFMPSAPAVVAEVLFVAWSGGGDTDSRRHAITVSAEGR